MLEESTVAQQGRRWVAAAALVVVLSGFGVLASSTAANGRDREVPLIAAEGDSLTYGQDTSADGTPNRINGASQARSISPYPEELGAELGANFQVVNRGFPGDQLQDGISRWANAPFGKFTIVMYGTNDALNFGQRPSGSTPVETFSAELLKYVENHKRRGSTVILLLPPAVADVAANARIEPYRQAIAEVGKREGVKVVDAQLLIQGQAIPWTDGVHLTPAAYRSIAKGLAGLFAEHR